MGLSNRLQHAWNAFLNKDPTSDNRFHGNNYSYRPDRPRLTRGNEKSIITSVYNRIAIDVSQTDIRHIRVDEDDRFLEEMDSSLNNCLSLEANLDQSHRAFLLDTAISLMDEGVIAIVPVDTDINPKTASFDVESMRTGKIIEWFPKEVRVELYNDNTGFREEIVLPKKMVCIVENPLYSIMNAPNSTLQRLIRKLALMDICDEKSSSGKLDLVIQLPYVVKTKAKEEHARSRIESIQRQLAESQYGIAYTDATEHITQLNRPLENKLLSQVEYLQTQLFAQLGITLEVLNGTADERTMNNYYKRTVVPILDAIIDEMKRKWLTKTGRTQGQTIKYFLEPFKYVTLTDLANSFDILLRNEVMSSNEARQILGFKPSDDPMADELVNSNNITRSEDQYYNNEEEYPDEV